MATFCIFLARREDGSGSRFLEQERQYSKEEERLMFSLTLQKAIRVVMSHHVYSRIKLCRAMEVQLV